MQLQIAYTDLIYEFKNDIKLIGIKEKPPYKKNDKRLIKLPFYEKFEKSLKEAFNLENAITSDEFISFMESYFLSNNEIELKKAYNLISNKLQELLEFRRLRFNPTYYQTKSLYENSPMGFTLFIINLGFKLDENGNYQQPLPDFFTANDLFDKIENEIIKTKSKLDKIFTLKKLNETQSITTSQPTPPQNKISRKEKIKWNKKTVLLAYLINELKTYGFIDDESIWAICEQIFVDKNGNPIKATSFTSMVKNYENNKTTDGTKGKPQSHIELTELIQNLKAISKELK